MLVAKIIICILTFIALFVARTMYEVDYQVTRSSSIVAGFAGLLGNTFCVLLITTNWNLFTIPKILLFISICLYILFKEECEACVPFWVGIILTIIAYIVTGIMYLNNFMKCEAPDVETTSSKIICAKDNSSVTGSISGGIWYVRGSTKEESVYQYYYLLEDGGIRQGTIPADLTTIYLFEDEGEAHLETTVTTEYWLNNNKSPATRCLEVSETTYKLYIPDGSITNVYEFDAE